MVFVCVLCVCGIQGMRLSNPQKISVVARSKSPIPRTSVRRHSALISTPPPAPRPVHPRSLYSLSHTPRDALRSSPRHSHAFVRPCGRCASSLAPHQSVPAYRSRSLSKTHTVKAVASILTHAHARAPTHGAHSRIHSVAVPRAARPPSQQEEPRQQNIKPTTRPRVLRSPLAAHFCAPGMVWT